MLSEMEASRTNKIPVWISNPPPAPSEISAAPAKLTAEPVHLTLPNLSLKNKAANAAEKIGVIDTIKLAGPALT
ncbi:hypothetical protein OSK10_28080, partial [Escherichia coli]|nr:hypothetical protein [Escherichia coli]